MLELFKTENLKFSKEYNLDSTIDSFVHIPILIAAAAGLILFILLLLSKIRNTSKVSFVFYLAIGIGIAGLLYTYKNRQLMYLVVTLLLSEIPADYIRIRTCSF